MHFENGTPLQLGHGQLYIKDLETGATVPCEIKLGSGDTLAEITLPETETEETAEPQAVRRINNDLPAITIDMEPTPAFEEWLQGQAAAYQSWVAACVKKAMADCVEWAKTNRPEWCHIMRRTKKKRTRKKYAQRIMREYVATVKAAAELVATGLTVNEARERMGLPRMEEA